LEELFRYQFIAIVHLTADIGAGGARTEYPLHGCVTLPSVHEVIIAHDDHDHGDPAEDP
jgi:hypothetical protein